MGQDAEEGRAGKRFFFLRRRRPTLPKERKEKKEKEKRVLSFGSVGLCFQFRDPQISCMSFLGLRLQEREFECVNMCVTVCDCINLCVCVCVCVNVRWVNVRVCVFLCCLVFAGGFVCVCV